MNDVQWSTDLISPKNVAGTALLASIASVELRRLRDLTGETSYLAVQEGAHVLALGRFESAHDKRSNARLGVLKPMHCNNKRSYHQPSPIERNRPSDVTTFQVR